MEYNLRQMDLGWSKDKDVREAQIMSKMPGASIGKLISCSPLRAANEAAGWKSADKGELDLKMGFPDPTGPRVEAELRFDGQDGNQWAS